MSEYQYYEFLAVDRSLTDEERAALRTITTRATITPWRLQNVYHWGSFKGDPLDLMTRYFDLFVYVANWGTADAAKLYAAVGLEQYTTTMAWVKRC